MIKKVATILILCLFHVAGNSQVRVEGSASTGVLIQHKFKNMASLAKERPYAYALCVSQQTDSNQVWAASYNYPRYGMELLFLSPGDPEDIGYAYCVIPYIRFSFLRKNYLFDPGFYIGIGMGYITKPFDPNNNYKNFVISRHWNVAATLNLDVETRLSDHFFLRSSVGVAHFSNGAIKMPNYGLNIFTGTISASYVLSEKNVLSLKNKPDELKQDHRTHIDLFFSGGQKENRILLNGEKYRMGAISAQGSYRYGRVLAVGATADLFYDSSERAEKMYVDSASIAYWRSLKPGLAISHEFFFGRISAFLQYGIYIHLNKYSDQATYQRLALRYAITNRIRGHFGIKTNFFEADYMELGMGIRLY